MIPYGRQDIRETDIQAVTAALLSDWLTQGPAVPAFEAALAKRCGARHAVAANSATSALHLACLALEVGPGDRVWTSAVTFVASANCARYCGADVDLVDIDPLTYNMSVPALAIKLEVAARSGALPKVVIPVHLCGQSCDMAAIQRLAQVYGFRVLEDASHAIGGFYRNEPVGNCRYSDISVFSFHPVKIITTGEGGMAMTNDSALARRMRLLRTHGIARDAEDLSREPDGAWYYEQVELGFNYRMTDVQAALGMSQLQRLDEYHVRRKALARRYDALLASLPVKTPQQDPDVESGWHIYVVRLRLDRIGRSHREVFDAVRAAGIGVNLHYMPVYRHPYYERQGLRRIDYPEAERYYAEAITLPLFPGLADAMQDHVVNTLGEACRA
jgi:UDP-4-amino-4,6-dideoxy-N-acetyl-beta-L-altrosamine transaminase